MPHLRQPEHSTTLHSVHGWRIRVLGRDERIWLGEGSRVWERLDKWNLTDTALEDCRTADQEKLPERSLPAFPGTIHRSLKFFYVFIQLPFDRLQLSSLNRPILQLLPKTLKVFS